MEKLDPLRPSYSQQPAQSLIKKYEEEEYCLSNPFFKTFHSSRQPVESFSNQRINKTFFYPPSHLVSSFTIHTVKSWQQSIYTVSSLISSKSNGGIFLECNETRECRARWIARPCLWMKGCKRQILFSCTKYFKERKWEKLHLWSWKL